MLVAVLKETFPGERRVALIPANIPALTKGGLEVVVEEGAGTAAGFGDAQYTARGARVAADRSELFRADIVLQVRVCGTHERAERGDLARLRPGCVLIGLSDPLGSPEAIRALAQTGASLFALELIPRITRAQAMDVLSSQATIAGYRAVLWAALELPKLFPLLMTAAGTLAAARTFVIGAGVAGLQAIATARRLGAIVQAYDVRPATREQVESLGAKFVAFQLDAQDAEDQEGYAKALGAAFYRQQQEWMASVVAHSDVVITTAAIPGQPSPRLITAEAVQGMLPGSVIIDLAAERGGNCELSRPDERVVAHGVVIRGPTNLPAEVPGHASQMYSNNITKFLLNMVKGGELTWNLDDQIVRETLVCRQGEVTNPRLRERWVLAPTDPGPVAPSGGQRDDRGGDDRGF